MFDLKKVEDWQPNPADASELKLRGTNHYIRLHNGDKDIPEDEQGPYFICDGHVYVEGGYEIPKGELPQWFWDQTKNIKADALEAARSTSLLKSLIDPSPKK